MCQGFTLFKGFLHHFVLFKLFIGSTKANMSHIIYCSLCMYLSNTSMGTLKCELNKYKNMLNFFLVLGFYLQTHFIQTNCALAFSSYIIYTNSVFTFENMYILIHSIVKFTHFFDKPHNIKLIHLRSMKNDFNIHCTICLRALINKASVHHLDSKILEKCTPGHPNTFIRNVYLKLTIYHLYSNLNAETLL